MSTHILLKWIESDDPRADMIGLYEIRMDYVKLVYIRGDQIRLNGIDLGQIR